LARHNYFLWGLAFTFHASLAAIVFGHLRLFQEPTWLWSLLRLDKSGVEAFAFYAGGMAGILMTVAAAGLSGRRLKGVTRLVSVPEDYFILAFIISLAFTGLYLRLFAVMNVQELQQYFTGLISLRLSLSPSVENPYYLVHSTITQLFLIYFPFSKLVHLAGSFITNYIYRR
jgi:nitrate reductase gamma subunit